MYAVKKEGAFAGYADSIVLIRLHLSLIHI